jgi:hypothetical protein
MEILEYFGTWISSLTFSQGLVVLVLGVLGVFLKMFFGYIDKKDQLLMNYDLTHRGERAAQHLEIQEARKIETTNNARLAEALYEMSAVIKINTEVLRHK